MGSSGVPAVPLRRSEVHIWTIDLPPASAAGGADAFAAALEQLDDGERARAQRLGSSAKRHRYVIARAALRRLIGAYLECDARSVAFEYGPRGKPAVRGVFFNLTHAGDLALAAFACDRDVGIDLEALRPVPDLEGIVSHHFAPSEARRILAAPSERRDTLFYACWTRKEAVTKALGLGLAVPLDSFAVSLPGDEPARVLDAGAPVAPAHGWSLTAISPRGGYAAALAVRGVPPRVVLWQESI